MTLKIKGIKIEISFYFTAVISILLLVNPNGSTLALFLFCILHETGHLSGMMLMGQKAEKIELGYYGMKICRRSNGVSKISEIIICVSGPLINIISYLVLKALKFDELANINIILAVFNLLPVKILDGGRILSVILNYKVVNLISRAVNIIIIITGIVVLIYSKTNYSILLVGLYILIGDKNNI